MDLSLLIGRDTKWDNQSCYQWNKLSPEKPCNGKLQTWLTANISDCYLYKLRVILSLYSINHSWMSVCCDLVRKLFHHLSQYWQSWNVFSLWNGPELRCCCFVNIWGFCYVLSWYPLPVQLFSSGKKWHFQFFFLQC